MLLGERHPVAGADGQHLVVEVVIGAVQPRRLGPLSGAEPDVAAGLRLQHVGEVLAAHLRRRIGDDTGGTDDRGGGGQGVRGLVDAVDDGRIAALVAQRRLHLEHRGDAGDERAHPRLDQRLHRRVERAHRAAQHHFFGNHVPGVAAVHLGDADDAGVQRMQVAGDDGLQRLDRVRGEQHRILALVGHRRVGALAGDDDLEDVERTHQRPGPRRDAAGRQLRPVVHPVDRAHREAVEQPLLDHHPPAAFVLLGGLEDEVDGAGAIPALRQGGRRAEQHGRVAVVSAGVHPALVAGGVRDSGLFVDVQRVEVGAQADGRSAVAGRQHADDAGLPQAGVDVETEQAQLRGHEGTGGDLFERGFRMRVQMVAPGLHLRDQRGDFGDDRHRGILAGGGAMRRRGMLAHRRELRRGPEA